MKCLVCNRINDLDAAFCADCGRPLSREPAEKSLRSRRIYLSALLFIPVLIGVAAMGYSKFFLPDGVVAVVNGEEIKRSELEDAAALVQKARQAMCGPAALTGERGAGERMQLRYEALRSLIRERLALQEARKAGVQAFRDEIAAGVTAARLSSGMDEAGFRAYAAAQYGDREVFEGMIARRIMIDKLLSERVVKGISDPSTARAAVSAWFQELSRKATVRVSITEQWSGAGCGYCAGEPSR